MTIREDQPRPMFAAQSALKAAAVWLSEWFSSCADHYAAAYMYECLSRLSDEELERRGLSRATLALDLVRMHDRTSQTNTATTETAHIKETRARAARAGEAARAQGSRHPPRRNPPLRPQTTTALPFARREDRR